MCRYLFNLKSLPNENDVLQNWLAICKEEQGSVSRDIEFLTTKQKILLTEIARHPDLKEPSSKEFTALVNMSPRGVLTTINTLTKYDLIERLPSGKYRIIDPVLEYWALSSS